MPRTFVLRAVVASATVLGLGALVAVQSATAASPHTRTTELWTPTPAPLPARLPDGGQPVASLLRDTSCSSTSFCVAVGYVQDNGNTYPLVETDNKGVWVASLAPMPQGYVTNGNVGALYSVSCASDGHCAAVGDYDISTQTQYDIQEQQNGLLETLSNGTWTATEASRATIPSSGGLVNLNSVSCSDATTCMGVGDWSYAPSQSIGLAFVLSSDGWTLETSPPVPSDYGFGVDLTSDSCPSDGNCVVVGEYGATNDPPGLNQAGLILTYSSGNWTAEEAPLPTQVNPPAGGGQLNAVDCVDIQDCVAGGWYWDTSQNDDPLIETLSGGTWVPTEAPVPKSVEPYQVATINGMSCPAQNACMADGSYLNPTATVQGGLFWTESASGWSASLAPVTASASHAAGRKKKTKTTLTGVSCVSKSSCLAVGSSGTSGVIETMAKR